MNIEYPIIINKYIAKTGIASRKESDRLLKAGKIWVNNKLAEPGQMINIGDKVVVEQEKTLYYYAFNKPKGIVSSCGQGDEKNITDYLDLPAGVVPIGRLDKQSEGLIILSNDGRITDRLLNPNRDHEKEYIVLPSKKLNNIELRQLSQGVVLDDGYKTKPAKVKQCDGLYFSIVITEGKNRQIRRMVEAVGARVRELRRVRIMHINLGNLALGKYRDLTKAEIDKILSI